MKRIVLLAALVTMADDFFAAGDRPSFIEPLSPAARRPIAGSPLALTAQPIADICEGLADIALKAGLNFTQLCSCIALLEHRAESDLSSLDEIAASYKEPLFSVIELYLKAGDRLKLDTLEAIFSRKEAEGSLEKKLTDC